MTRYYPKRNDAQEAAQQILAADDRISWAKVELEPSNGWVVVIAAKPRDLSDLAAEGYEVDIDGRRTRDPNKKRMPPVAMPTSKREPGAPGAAPSAGATRKVWDIATRVTAANNGAIDRAAIIAACVAEGINPATAGTQYSKWKKAQ